MCFQCFFESVGKGEVDASGGSIYPFLLTYGISISFFFHFISCLYMDNHIPKPTKSPDAVSAIEWKRFLLVWPKIYDFRKN